VRLLAAGSGTVPLIVAPARIEPYDEAVDHVGRGPAGRLTVAYGARVAGRVESAWCPR
jgi:hypothetical protein